MKRRGQRNRIKKNGLGGDLMVDVMVDLMMDWMVN